MARTETITPRIPPIAGVAITVAILYFARELCIPLVFAILLAFLLEPVAKRLEGWRVPRIPAAIAAFLMASAVVAIVGWLVAVQLIQIASSLPQYRDNVQRKLQVLQSDSRSVSAVITSIEDIAKEAEAPHEGGQEPMPVRMVEDHSIAQVVRDYAGGLLRPLGTLGLIMVFTIFMLIDRENLRNRLLRLMGQSKLQATTKAMDDAGTRVSRYLRMQFMVNASFGAVIGSGLYLLGVPSALLWGVLGACLRFLPYVGPVIAWVLPFALTLAVSDGWRTPLLVTALFAVTELVVANFIEPLVYGVHTGLSAMAVLVSVVFWTVIWGPVGLVLATPLTVCLSALGRYSPQLEFLNVVLGDEPVLAPSEMFYQRLIALDQQDAFNVIEAWGRDKSLAEIADALVLPALAMAERDRMTGELDPKREDFVIQSVNELVTDITESEIGKREEPVAGARRVLCIPANDAADEIAASLCAQVLTQKGWPAIAFPITESPGDLMLALGANQEDVICVSSVPPFAAGNARKMVRGLKEKGIESELLVGLWGHEFAAANQKDRMAKSVGAAVATSIAGLVESLENPA
jgi:predicted PurR-regulated permease PerM